ncbi:MAG: hypothetical protein PVJ57_19615 [Phycisphaerae bacterium]|jgi:hypothetical protein
MPRWLRTLLPPVSRRLTWWAAALLLLSGWVGCTRSPNTTTTPAQGSPRQTVERLIELRAAGNYQDMQPLIVPERAADVVVTLVAVQEFLSANDELCRVIRDEVGEGLAKHIDQSFRAYYLDIFSKYVEVLDEQATGSTAIVSFTVDGRLPAVHADLRLVEGRWCYDPGPGDYRQLAEGFRQMARGLRHVVTEIEEDRLSSAELREHPELLEREVRLRLLPGIKSLPAMPTSAPAETQPAAP